MKTEEMIKETADFLYHKIKSNIVGNYIIVTIKDSEPELFFQIIVSSFLKDNKTAILFGEIVGCEHPSINITDPTCVIRYMSLFNNKVKVEGEWWRNYDIDTRFSQEYDVDMARLEKSVCDYADVVKFVIRLRDALEMVYETNWLS